MQMSLHLQTIQPVTETDNFPGRSRFDNPPAFSCRDAHIERTACLFGQPGPVGMTTGGSLCSHDGILIEEYLLQTMAGGHDRLAKAQRPGMLVAGERRCSQGKGESGRV